jgi:glycosyltransferase involved in cell wall biosynthesis
VGRRRPVKGYEVGLRAFARAAAAVPRAVYVLVGHGIPQLEALVRELQLEGRVRLLDRMPAAELPSVFRSADVFFSPSFMEGFSQVNMQAMASGLPCVISDGPGNIDAATGGGAVAVRTGDEESMARALGSLLRDADARRRLGAEAHERSRRFAWSRIAEDYLEVFADPKR